LFQVTVYYKECPDCERKWAEQLSWSQHSAELLHKVALRAFRIKVLVLGAAEVTLDQAFAGIAGASVPGHGWVPQRIPSVPR